MFKLNRLVSKIRSATKISSTGVSEILELGHNLGTSLVLGEHIGAELALGLTAASRQLKFCTTDGNSLWTWCDNLMTND